jgi:hypothetical protein
MKNIRKLSMLVVLALSAGFASAVTSPTVTPILTLPNYSLDQYMGKALLGNSSTTSELDYLKVLTGISTLTLELRDNTPGAQANSGYTTVTGTGRNQGTTTTYDSWFINVAPDTPGYFVLKFGIGSTTAPADTYFFKNVTELTKLVFATSDVDGLTASNIGRLSHYTTVKGDTGAGGAGGTVPEPATTALLGLGLLGFAASRRKSAKSKNA